MRVALTLAALAFLTASPILDARTLSPAQAEETCTGENCTPTQGGSSSGGHECESKKKEQTVS